MWDCVGRKYASELCLFLKMGYITEIFSMLASIRRYVDAKSGLYVYLHLHIVSYMALEAIAAAWSISVFPNPECPRETQRLLVSQYLL